MYVFMNWQSCKAFGLSNGLTMLETTILWLFTSTNGDGSCNSCLGDLNTYSWGWFSKDNGTSSKLKSCKKICILTSPLISIVCYIFVRPLCPSSNTRYLKIIIIFVLRLKQWYNFKILSYLLNMHLIYLSSSFVLLFILFLHIVLQEKKFQQVNVKWW
jgi:hypothetical protein